jgi:uncharacterized protein
MLSIARRGLFLVLTVLATVTVGPVLAQTSAASCDLCAPAAAGDLGRIQQMLDRGANVRALDQGSAPLGWALSRDRFDAALLLLGHRADPNAAIPGKAAYTPLSYAAQKGDVGLVHALIKAGANVNARAAGATALDWATRIFSASLQPQHASIIRLLLDAGADPNALVANGGTPLGAVAQAIATAPHPDDVLPLMKIMLVRGAGTANAIAMNEAMGWAEIRGGNPSLIALLLAYGARINPTDSALVLNDMRRRPELIPRLIDAGAMIDQANDGHETALTLAVKEDDVAQVRRLLALGADPNHQNSEGPPYSQLVNKGQPNPEMFRVLIEAGEDLGYLFYEPGGKLYILPATDDDFRKSLGTSLADESKGQFIQAFRQRYAVLSGMTEHWHPPLSNQDLDPSPDSTRRLAKLTGPAPGSVALDKFNYWRSAAGDYLATANAQAAFYAASRGLATLPPIADEARRHEAEGKALYLKAASASGALAAAAEYRAAAGLAPWVPAYHRNLCVLYQLGGALIRAYEHCAIYASGHPEDLDRIEEQMTGIADRVPYYMITPKNPD